MILHHIAHDFDATRHFLFSQAHPVVWWGNIVAGVVVFIVINICWQWFLKKWVKAGLAKIHREELERHHREVVKPLLESQQAQGEEMTKKNDARFQAIHDKLDAQHAEQMNAHNVTHMDTAKPARVKNVVKKVAAKKQPAKKNQR